MKRKSTRWRRRSSLYNCAVCKEPIRANIDTVGIQCEKCGSKIFYKAHMNVKKRVRAR
jgi:DNA-directed RNA polymerase subunit P